MKQLFLTIAVLTLSVLSFGQAQNNPTGLVYQTPNYNPSTDTQTVTNLNVTGTLGTGNSTARGQGIYVFTGHREDSQCLMVFASNDGVTVKPMFPFGNSVGCLYWGNGSTDTAVRDPQIFRAPWNNLWYIAYTPNANASHTQYFGTASSRI